MPSSDKDKSAYETYRKWYKKVSKSNKMTSNELTFNEFKLQSKMYKAIAKDTLSKDKDDVIAKRALKNITRFIAYDQVELSKAQLNAIDEGLKDLKIKHKISDIKKQGKDYVKNMLPEGVNLTDVYDLGSA